MDCQRERLLLSLVDVCMSLERGERLTFLRANCLDEQMIEEACGLLDGVSSDDDFLEKPLPPMVPVLPDAEPDPEQVGPYRILRLLGKGGMGSVYLAEQAEPKRLVALKMIRWEVLSEQTMARFTIEYQSLARMSHANIARVYDVGSYKGCPYFTMEYFDGIPIDRYADQHRLNVRERLDLFLKACSGIAHAHRNGVIHRDLKPGNVLVRQSADGPSLRIIDFGIAKGMDDELRGNHPGTTVNGFILGTPAYMSPEQVDRQRGALDTRTDVFGLGAILFELLTGRPPVAPDRLFGASITELYRAICQEEPQPPSRLVGGAAMETINIRQVRGELDWITLKALARDPERRYASAADLAEDVKRYLEFRPIDAGPPSLAYRVRKHIRRHRTVVVTGILLAVSLVMVWSWWSARKEAEKSTDWAGTVTGLFNETLSDMNPYKSMERPSFPAFLESVSKRISQIDEDSALAMTLQTDFANALAGMGRPRPALECLNSAIDIAGRILPPGDPYHFYLRERKSFFTYLKGDLASAETLFRVLIIDIEKDNNVDKNLLFVARRGYGEVMLESGKIDSSLMSLFKTLEEMVSQMEENNPEVFLTKKVIANALRAKGEIDEAEALYSEVREGFSNHPDFGPDHPETLSTRRNILILYHDRGQFAEVEKKYRDLLDHHERVKGAFHVETLECRSGLGVNLLRQGKLEEGRKIMRTVYEQQREVLGEDHVDFFNTAVNLAHELRSPEKIEDASEILESVLPSMSRVLEPDHRLFLNARLNLANLYISRGMHQDARALLMENIELLEEDKADSMRLLSVGTLAESHAARREYGRAIPLAEEFVALAPGSAYEAREHLPFFRSLLEEWRSKSSAPD